MKYRPLSVAAVLALSVAAFAQSNGPVLGERTAGTFDVSFKPFAGAKKIDRTSLTEQLRFRRDDKDWTLSFERAQLQGPLPLTDTADAQGKTRVGYLTTIVTSLRTDNPSADVLRNETLDLGQLRIGLIAAALPANNKPSLLQQAVIEVRPDLYYSIALTSPVPAKDLEQDPAVQEAVATFKAIVDSVEAVDTSKIKEEQDERLFRTRALFVGWNRAKFLSILNPEQMLRYRKKDKEGGYKDVGYAYVVEQVADALPRDGELAKPPVVDPQKAGGFRVGTRSRVIDEAGKATDFESWMYCSFDRRNEVWSSVSVVRDPSAKSEREKEVWFSEVGSSDLSRERVFDKDLQAKDFKEADKDRERLLFDVVDKYRLSVRTEQRSAVAQPITRELPPFYIPQAVLWTLPRLVPLNHATGYMFAVYNNGAREVMLRYLDVGQEIDVVLAGKRHRAVPVEERADFGLAPTTHYFTPKGLYLGTTFGDNDIEITPSDRATLEAVWKDSNLNAPGLMKSDAGK